MSFINKIDNIAKVNKKIKMFIDMDGTIVEFILDKEESFMKDGGYVSKKPITPIIDQLNKINDLYDNIDMYILSCARTKKMVNEKNEWIDKYIPYIKLENRKYLVKENKDYTIETADIVKSEYIKSILNENELSILIDDDLRILKQSQKIIGDRVIPFHVTSLLI